MIRWNSTRRYLYLSKTTIFFKTIRHDGNSCNYVFAAVRPHLPSTLLRACFPPPLAGEDKGGGSPQRRGVRRGRYGLEDLTAQSVVRLGSPRADSVIAAHPEPSRRTRPPRLGGEKSASNSMPLYFLQSIQESGAISDAQFKKLLDAGSMAISNGHAGAKRILLAFTNLQDGSSRNPVIPSKAFGEKH